MSAPKKLFLIGMNVSGPPPITNVPRPEDNQVVFRLNQRISAEVLQVAGDRVVLSVNGVQIVARLTTPDQAAALVDQKTAHFIVRDVSDQILGLQLQPQPAATPSTAPTPASDLAVRLLNAFDMPVDQANLLLAKPHQQVEGRLATPVWGQTEAQAAAALRQANLPISAGSIALAMGEWLPVVHSLSRLRSTLVELARSNPSDRLGALIRQTLNSLDSLGVDWGAPTDRLAESLRVAVRNFGRSIERQLAELLHQGSSLPEHISSSDSFLLILAQLRRELAYSGRNPLLEEIDRFLDEMRFRLLTNANLETEPYKEHWLKLDIPLALPSPDGHNPQEMRTSNLRIAYRAEEDQQRIDPLKSRLVIQVDIDAEDSMQIDLSIFENQIGAWINSSSHNLEEIARASMPELKTGLEKLGYHLKITRWSVDQPPAIPGDSLHTNKVAFEEVNLGV